MSEGVFTVGVVPASTGIETSTTGIVVVEWIDDFDTYHGKRREGVRRVVRAEELEPGLGLGEVISRTAEVCKELGREVTVLYSKEGSLATAIAWRDAYDRTGELPRWPRAVTVGGEGYGRDSDGHETVGEDELIDKSLRELVKARAFSIEEGAAQVAAAARAMVPDLSPVGRVKLGPRKRNSLGFALAIALYPAFAPGHTGRRFRDASGRVWPSLAAARAHIGSAAQVATSRHQSTSFGNVTSSRPMG